MGNNRTTCLIGAGTPLDLVLPQDVIKPTTTNITSRVCEPYENYLNPDNPITVVDDIYNRLVCTYPPDRSNPCISKIPTPYIHFEHLFHVLEMLYSYGWVWSGNCKSPNLYPAFAPFTRSNPYHRPGRRGMPFEHDKRLDRGVHFSEGCSQHCDYLHQRPITFRGTVRVR